MRRIAARARVLVLGGLLAAGCGDTSPIVDAPPVDAGTVDGPVVTDAVDCDGGCAGAGEVCGTSTSDLDAGALPCSTGLVCCYPCGIPDCNDQCTAPCAPGPGCQDNGCPGPFP